MFSHQLSPTVFLRPRRLAQALLVALAATAFLAAGATRAGAELLSTGACNNAALSQPFTSWGDANDYELLPGGDFEAANSGWMLSGAQRVAGSEPFHATGTAGAYSLSLHQGASAQSPFTCLTAAYPTFRFFARNEGVTSTILAQVVYKTALGEVALPLGVVTPGGEWRPTPPMLTGSVVLGALSGGTAQAALRFTELTGSSRIDDIFIDPRMR